MQESCCTCWLVLGQEDDALDPDRGMFGSGRVFESLQISQDFQA